MKVSARRSCSKACEPRASTATCASTSCALLAVPGHLFQLLGDVFTGVRGPIQDQAAARCRGLVWSWASALAAQPDGGQASRTSMTAGSVAWANMEYADTDVKAKSPKRHLQTRPVCSGGGWCRRGRCSGYENEPEAHAHALAEGFRVLQRAAGRASTRCCRSIRVQRRAWLSTRDGGAAHAGPVHGDVFSQAMSQPSMQQVNLVSRGAVPGRGRDRVEKPGGSRRTTSWRGTGAPPSPSRCSRRAAS